ncbi:helix-turn-helix domain-containing protein [Haloarculaceae archaeon H-GB2-1]|nr:helix-turn-helix domain-containing protein [Haloarculaceae archaeon H-GB1-1]MEA5386862.1 helix-turn-helix domain-containing protein [Haloarculaceae archaeon H-GB11]MEA5408337.1 helix-turn-helix domain-containing protein [Haloarculaceae archaeon H-GB2-1]
MVTARLAVRYEDDWTAHSEAYDVYGNYLAYSVDNNRKYALIVLTAETLDSAIELVRTHETVTSVRVLDHRESATAERGSATLFVESSFREFPPLQLLTFEGFVPIGNPSLRDGWVVVDLLFDDLDDLDRATSTLEAVGPVQVESLSETFRYHATPDTADVARLTEALSPRQLEVLSLAVEHGYFELPRNVTIAELAAELDVAASTVSDHLRNARATLIQFVVDHIVDSAHRERMLAD